MNDEDAEGCWFSALIVMTIAAIALWFFVVGAIVKAVIGAFS